MIKIYEGSVIGNKSYDYYLDRDENNAYRRRNARNGYRTLDPTRGQKSFYGKAHTIDTDDGGTVLISYDTPVCGYMPTENGDLEFQRYWDGWSTTTAKHINSFRDMLGDRGLGKAEWMKLPVVSYR